MRPAILLRLMAFACAAWLAALPAAAEEDKHSENSRSRPAAPGGNSVRTPPAGGSNSGPAAAPQAPQNSGSRESNEPSFGASLLGDILFGSSSSSSSDSHSYQPAGPHRDTDYYTQLRIRGFASYYGASIGKSIAYYPSNPEPDFAWKLFGGARLKYVGAELGYSHLGKTRTVNSLLVDARADTFSLSILGYLPLGRNADLFARYGGDYWQVSTNNSATGIRSAQDGFNRVRGFGLEYRDGESFIRIEKEIYRAIYQSNNYSYVGISIGTYTD